jgi:outer membrane protein W
MKRIFATAIAVALTVFATPARAADEGFQLALRAGYAIPLGDAVGGTPSQPLSDSVKGAIPLQLDVGYRFAKNWFVGGYFQYAFGMLNKDAGKTFAICDTGGNSCSSYDLRFGIEGAYNFMPGQDWQPWVGLGVGYEIAHISATVGGASDDFEAKGWEFANVQLGVDYMVSPMFSVGPYVMFSIGQYSTTSTAGVSTDITNKGTHEWLSFGLKGTFNL